MQEVSPSPNYGPLSGFHYYNLTISPIMRVPSNHHLGTHWTALRVWVLGTFTSTQQEKLIWVLMFNATCKNMSVYFVVVSFIGGGKPEYQEKNTDLSQVTDKLYHIMLHTSPWTGFEPTTLVAIGTYCIGSCKSNYHTIPATGWKSWGWRKEWRQCERGR